MNKSNKFSPEVRERAVRMVQEHRGEYPSLWAAVESIAAKIGCAPQTLLEWVKREEVDAGARPGLSTVEAQRIKDLEREVMRPCFGLGSGPRHAQSTPCAQVAHQLALESTATLYVECLVDGFV